MGTDIHMHVETQKADGTWQAHNPPPMPSDWQADNKYKDHVGMYLKAADKTERVSQEWEIPRNYDTFAILADVRNGYGFAGCKTGDGFNTITGEADTRGLPEDLSPELTAQFEEWLEHSPHWLLLSEVLAFDWDQETKKSGVVDPEQYKEWKQKGSPDYYSGGVSGGDTVHVSNKEMEHAIAGHRQTVVKESLYTRVEWGVKYRDQVWYLLNHFIPEVQKLHPDPSKIRLVMFFDS